MTVLVPTHSVLVAPYVTSCSKKAIIKTQKGSSVVRMYICYHPAVTSTIINISVLLTIRLRRIINYLT